MNDIQWRNYFLGTSTDHNTSQYNQIFKFQFGVINGIIDKLTYDSIAKDTIIEAHSIHNGTLYIKFPRSYPFAQGYSNASAHYEPFVSFLLNGTNDRYPMSKSDCFFVYSVPFSGNSRVDMIITYPSISDLPNIYHGDTVSPLCNYQTIVSYMPPLEQINAGVDPKDVQCITEFVVLLHPGNKMPVCVKPNTSKILVERGWAKTS